MLLVVFDCVYGEVVELLVWMVVLFVFDVWFELLECVEYVEVVLFVVWWFVV